MRKRVLDDQGAIKELGRLSIPPLPGRCFLVSVLRYIDFASRQLAGRKSRGLLRGEEVHQNCS